MCLQINNICSNRKSIPLMASYLVLEEEKSYKQRNPQTMRYLHLLRKQAENNFKVAKINLSLLTQRMPIWLSHQTWIENIHIQLHYNSNMAARARLNEIQGQCESVIWRPWQMTTNNDLFLLNPLSQGDFTWRQSHALRRNSIFYTV